MRKGMRGMKAVACLVAAALVGGAAAVELPEEAVRGRDFAFCNVGSNSGIYGFDWESAGVRGLGLATSPQSVDLGFELLERYADRLAAWLGGFLPLSESLLHTLTLVLLTVILSYLTLLFGELVPKRLGMHYPEKIAYAIAWCVFAAIFFLR